MVYLFVIGVSTEIFVFSPFQCWEGVFIFMLCLNWTEYKCYSPVDKNWSPNLISLEFIFELFLFY